MKKSFKSRLRNDLFPDIPQSFKHRVSAVLPVQNADTRRRTPWLIAATVALGFVVAACFVLVITVALQDRQAKPAMPGETETLPILDTWELDQIDINGLLISAEYLGGSNAITFYEDGTAKITGIGIFNAQGDGATVSYAVDGQQVTLLASGVLTDGVDTTFTYDPEKDTLTAENLPSTMSKQGSKAIFCRRQTAAALKDTFDPKGKWTLTKIESTLPEIELKYVDTSGSWMIEEYLEFSGDGSATWKTYDAAVGKNCSEQYRYSVSGNTVDLQKVDDPAHTALIYDPTTDTLRLDAFVAYSNPHAEDDVVTLIYSRTPDAVISSSVPGESDDNLAISEEDLAALRTKYPEYFGLDTESGLKVFVAEFACDYFSCTLLSGKDKNKSLMDISTMRGTTVGEMLTILSDYDIPTEKIEVIPYVNPLSSYAYTIDALYTSYVTWKIKGGLPFLDAVQFDLDGDGREELITLTYGPTSGLFTVVLSVYRNGKTIERNTYNLCHGELALHKTADGLRLSHTYSEWMDSAPQTDVYAVSIRDGRIVWTNEETGKEFSGYWGDGSWNLDGKDPASIDTSGVTVSSSYICVGATAGGRLVPIPEAYLDTKHGLEYDNNDPRNETDGSNAFVWVKQSYITAVDRGLSNQAWGTLEHFKGDAPAALRWETELTAENGEPIVLHFALCDQPMEYEFLVGILSGGIIADAGPRLKEPTAETLFYADWDEDGVYEYLAYLKLPETGTCLISDGERAIVLTDCISVRGFYTDLDTKSPYGNLILSTETADRSKRVYELHPEGDAIVIGNTLNGYCFVDDGVLTEDEPYDLCIGEPSPFGSAHGYYTVHGDALTPWGHYRVALEIEDTGIDIQKDRDWLVKKGWLLKLKRDLPCSEGTTLEAGTYVYLVNYLDTLTEAKLRTEDGRTVIVTMNGDANDLRIGGIPVSDYFE